MLVEKYELYYNGRLIKTIGYSERVWLESRLLAGGETMEVDGVEYDATEIDIKDVSYVGN